MDNFKTFLNQYFWLIVMVCLAIIATLAYLIYGSYQESSLDRTIKNNQTQAQSAVNTAANSNANAANFAVARRAEDAVRERVIMPKLETARRNSNNSKIDLERSRTKYENEKINHPPVSNSRAVNCDKLRELFPNKRFEYCGDAPINAGR